MPTRTTPGPLTVPFPRSARKSPGMADGAAIGPRQPTGRPGKQRVASPSKLELGSGLTAPPQIKTSAYIADNAIFLFGSIDSETGVSESDFVGTPIRRISHFRLAIRRLPSAILPRRTPWFAVAEWRLVGREGMYATIPNLLHCRLEVCTRTRHERAAIGRSLGWALAGLGLSRRRKAN